jgi:hypothetical protein
MAWLLIDVELKVLSVHQEAATLFEDGEVSVVLLSQHVKVVTLCQLCLDFNRLPMNVRTACGVDVTELNRNLN